VENGSDPLARRVDVDASLPPVAFPGRVLNELCAHALETLPEECCGLVLGRGDARFARVARCRNEMTRRHLADPRSHPRDGRAAFWMNEADYAQAQAAAEQIGDEVTAIYHSHVDMGVHLSELDLEYAEHPLFPFPSAAQIVIAVHERRVVGLGLFQREGAGKPFVGLAILSAAP
jgi:proteasome lid subunit RPN8/RPN11